MTYSIYLIPEVSDVIVVVYSDDVSHKQGFVRVYQTIYHMRSEYMFLFLNMKGG
jgi:hypothetical protein